VFHFGYHTTWLCRDPKPRAVLLALPAVGITMAIVLGGLNQLGPVAFVFSAAWWPHLLSAAGLLSLDMRSGKKGTIVPDGG
jgi:hypothetical protein